MSNPCLIERLDILPRMDGGTILYWYFAERTVIPADAVVHVEFSRHATEEAAAWTPIGNTPAHLGFFLDPDRHAWGQEAHIYYRIRVSSSECDDRDGICISRGSPFNRGAMPCELRGVVREILRREQLRQRNGETQVGTLLKRKYSGVECILCRDPDYPGRVINSSCENCYSTGWVGGYYHNPNFHVDMEQYGGQNQRGEMLDAEVGEYNSVIRYLNIPAVQPGDIWVDYQSDHRWLVENIQTLTRAGSYVLLQGSKITRLNFSDIAYRIPVDKS